MNETCLFKTFGPQHSHRLRPDSTSANDRFPSFPRPAALFSALIAEFTASGAYIAESSTHRITALNSCLPSVPASLDAVATMNANSPQALMAKPIFAASCALNGRANKPVATLPNAASMNTAARASTGAVHRSRMGTSKPIVHAKKTRMSQERIFSTCACQTCCMEESEQKQSPPRNAPSKWLLLP